MTGMNRRAVPHLGTYDVVVNGGGLTGIASAVTLARQGAKVALVERRGALGWEVARARRVFVDLAVAVPHSPLIREWEACLQRWNGIAEHYVDPAMSELFFDRWIVESGVVPLFHTWGVATSESGLVVGMKEGYRELRASVVIETDQPGRLVPDARKESVQPSPSIRAFLLLGAEVTAPVRLEVEVNDVTIPTLVRPLMAGRVQVDCAFTESEYAQRERVFSQITRELMLSLRREVKGLESATLAVIGDDEWSAPPFLVAGSPDAGRSSAADELGVLLTAPESEVKGAAEKGTVERVGAQPMTFTASQLPIVAGSPKVILAGPWIQAMHPLHENEEVSILNRVLLGEAAARYAATRLLSSGRLKVHAG